MSRQPPMGQDLPTVQASGPRSDSLNYVGFFWMSDQPNAEASI